MSPSPSLLSTAPRLNMRSPRRWALLLTDFSVLAASFWFAYQLRFDFAVPANNFRSMVTQLPIVLALEFAGLVVAGAQTFVWRYTGLRDLPVFGRAMLFTAVPLLILRVLLPPTFQAWRVPLSVIFINVALAFLGLLGVRVARRMLFESTERRRQDSHQQLRRVLLVGAGRAGILAAREIQNRGDVAVQIIGFVDDDPLKGGMVINGVRVLGTTHELPRLVREHEIQELVITIAEPQSAVVRRVGELAGQLGLRVRKVPGLYELLQGNLEISRFRQVDPEQLLQREPLRLDRDRLDHFLSGKRVLVTGAGGSIGAELARQIVHFRPHSLALVERAENALFEIDRELQARSTDTDISAIVGDIGDPHRVEYLFRELRPEIIVHAAAHKHVPLMESNAAEAVRNNVLATHTLAERAGCSGVETFVLISTDKAVFPTSVMGATKRLAELAIQDLDSRFDTRYVAVRFGNVLGSAGSVLPIFAEQIDAGGPVTVTHPEMRRYFMTVTEAVHLVLEAAAMGEGGEIFVLDMGEPVRIVDLAERMISLHGFVPHVDIALEFSGIRPGEKLFEEIGHDAEELAKTRHPKIFIGRIPPLPPHHVASALDRLRALSTSADHQMVRDLFAEILPEANLGPPKELLEDSTAS